MAMAVSTRVLLLAALANVLGYVFWIRYSDHLARVAVARPPAETDAGRIRRYLTGSLVGTVALAVLIAVGMVDFARITGQWVYLVGLPVVGWVVAKTWRFQTGVRVAHSPVLSCDELILGTANDTVHIPRANIESVTQTDDQALGGQALVAVSSFLPGPAATVRMRDSLDGVSTYLVVGDESEAFLRQFQDHVVVGEPRASQ
ncbi:MAG: hypothetical protein Q8K99_01190 [Actinomycetota bacterium]|nr:hypothetical protein [Actinomycetota bacterium]